MRMWLPLAILFALAVSLHFLSVAESITDCLHVDDRIDVGHIVQGDSRQFSLQLTNRSCRPIKCIRAHAGCGCIQLDKVPSSVGAYSTEVLVGRVVATKLVGIQSRILRIYLADNDRRWGKRVTITAIVASGLVGLSRIYLQPRLSAGGQLRLDSSPIVYRWCEGEPLNPTVSVSVPDWSPVAIEVDEGFATSITPSPRASAWPVAPMEIPIRLEWSVGFKDVLAITRPVAGLAIEPLAALRRGIGHETHIFIKADPPLQLTGFDAPRGWGIRQDRPGVVVVRSGQEAGSVDRVVLRFGPLALAWPIAPD